MKITPFVLFCMFLLSCTNQRNENQRSTTDTVQLESQAAVNQQRIVIPKKLYGKWIATTIFDSTLTNRKLDPSLRDMYGEALLIIDAPDSLQLEGTMDGGRILIDVLDSLTFRFKYDETGKNYLRYYPSKDVLIRVNKSDKYSTIYRRVKETDHLEILANEKLFDKFFINKFFSDYFTSDELAKIVYLNNGFLTYSPFDFDAIGIKDETGEIVYYAWTFVGDELELFETSHTFDKDSGFAIYKIEKLFKKIKKIKNGY